MAKPLQGIPSILPWGGRQQWASRHCVANNSVLLRDVRRVKLGGLVSAGLLQPKSSTQNFTLVSSEASFLRAAEDWLQLQGLGCVTLVFLENVKYCAASRTRHKHWNEIRKPQEASCGVGWKEKNTAFTYGPCMRPAAGYFTSGWGNSEVVHRWQQGSKCK